MSFNPCFIGTYSITQLHHTLGKLQVLVLILVLLELTLLPIASSINSTGSSRVLILVLLELTLLQDDCLSNDILITLF